MKLSFNYTHATVVKNGSKYHPALTNREEIQYFPNRTFNTHEDALLAAKLALGDALERAQHVCDTWNIVQSNTGLEIKGNGDENGNQ